MSTQTSTQSGQRHWWTLPAGLALLVLVILLLFRGWQRDAVVASALAQLQPGLPDAEVKQALSNVRHAYMTTAKGQPAYVFYGFGEFVNVVMETGPDGPHVARVEHDPDEGPAWDRFRRTWENRLR